MLEQERPGLRGTPARAPKSKGRAPSLGRSGQQPVSSSCRAALRFMQCLLLRLGLLDRLRPHSPSPGTCTDTQPAGDHRYTWLPPVQMASRGCRGSHRKDRTADSCSSTTKSLSFRTSQIQTALGMLSGEGRGPGLCSPPAPVQHPRHPNSPTPGTWLTRLSARGPAHHQTHRRLLRGQDGRKPQVGGPELTFLSDCLNLSLGLEETRHPWDGPLTAPRGQEVVVQTEGQGPDAHPRVGSVCRGFQSPEGGRHRGDLIWAPKGSTRPEPPGSEGEGPRPPQGEAGADSRGRSGSSRKQALREAGQGLGGPIAPLPP